uniref:Uncharacterized protein n=1 Tax=Setaria digitata TaxID=48799 RepID=A0A915PJT0_9BILA
MSRCYALPILFTLMIVKLSTSQFIPPYGTFGAFTPAGLLNPYLGAASGLGMSMAYDPMVLSAMGVNMFGNPYLTSPYASLAFTNNGNTLTGYGSQKYVPPMFSRKRFIPGKPAPIIAGLDGHGYGCLNRSGCGIGFQQKE